MESKIKDISLHETGRQEIQLAEVEMPGLMQCREEFGKSKVLAGARIMGSLHMTIQTAVLIETLTELGADVRWCSCNIYSTQDQAAAAIAKAGTAQVFAWKGETLQEYWQLTMNALTWPDGYGPNQIVDDGGDATILLIEGVKWEKIYKETKQIPEIDPAMGPDEQELYKMIGQVLQNEPDKFSRLAQNLSGISEETTTGVHRLYELEKQKKLLCPCINVNDSVTKTKFDNIYGCRHSLPDGLNRATDIMLAGKKVLVFGYGDVGKGCAASMKAANSIVYVAEVDPICALQACMEGYRVVKLDSVVEQMDIFITATGNKNIIMSSHMQRMKNNAIICNIGHFDNEIDMAGLAKVPGVQKQVIKDMVARWQFLNGKGVVVLAEGRLMNLGCATGHPSFVMSNSFTNQVLAQIELWTKKGEYKIQVYKLSRELDEKVARLHLPHLGAELTELSEEQAQYINVKIEGPYKKDEYKY